MFSFEIGFAVPPLLYHKYRLPTQISLNCGTKGRTGSPAALTLYDAETYLWIELITCSIYNYRNTCSYSHSSHSNP